MTQKSIPVQISVYLILVFLYPPKPANSKLRAEVAVALLATVSVLMLTEFSAADAVQETSELHRRQQDYQQKQVVMTKEDEEEYFNYCSEAMFRIHILEMRLNRFVALAGSGA